MVELYSASRATLLLPSGAYEVESPKECRNCIQVTYKIRGRRTSTFLSKKGFLAVAMREKVTAAADVEVIFAQEEDDMALVKSLDKQLYWVRLNHADPRFRCDCEGALITKQECCHQAAVKLYIKSKPAVNSEELALVPTTQQPAVKNEEQAVNVAHLTSNTKPATSNFLPPTETMLAVLPSKFGWGEVPQVKPSEIFYSRKRVTIWKMFPHHWGDYGHFLVVDSKYNAVVAIIRGNHNGTWNRADNLRTEYMECLDAVDEAAKKFSFTAVGELDGADNQRLFTLAELSVLGFTQQRYPVAYKPLKTYYESDRVQIWSHKSCYWGIYGKHWVVDTLQCCVVATEFSGSVEIVRQKYEQYCGITECATCV